MKSKLIMAAALSLFASTLLANASVPTKSSTPQWIFTPAASYLNYSSKRHLDDEWFPAFLVSYHLKDAWRAQLFLGHLSTEQTGGSRRNVTGWIVLGDAYYDFTGWQALHPYLLGGVGVVNLRPRWSNDPSVEANLNIGAGLSYTLSQYVGLRADLRDLYTPNSGKNDWMAVLGLDILI